jgi:hypothetical protein
MRLRLHSTFTLAVLVLGLSDCMFPPQIDVKASLGAELCRQVDIPDWSIDPSAKNPNNTSFETDDLKGPEFRAPAGHSGELYFAAVPREPWDMGPYSKEKYAVSISGSSSVHEIGRSEWFQAQPLTHFNSDSRPDWQIPDDDNIDISYKGKEFRKSGEHVLEGMVSANDRWIAVFSYDGQQTYLSPEQKKQQGYGCTPLGGCITKHPSQGELYVDIYDVGTGRKVIALQGAFRGAAANGLPITSFFLEDRYFFLNTGTPRINQFWLCALPNSPG